MSTSEGANKIPSEASCKNRNRKNEDELTCNLCRDQNNKKGKLSKLNLFHTSSIFEYRFLRAKLKRGNNFGKNEEEKEIFQIKNV